VRRPEIPAWFSAVIGKRTLLGSDFSRSRRSLLGLICRKAGDIRLWHSIGPKSYWSAGGITMVLNLGGSGRPSILAIVYCDSAAACRSISELGYRIRDGGGIVAGIVPYHAARDEAPRCDMEVEELASRFILQLAEDTDKKSSGCRIDPAALQEAAALIAAAFNKDPELVIINKFGRLEAEGFGLGEVISETVDRGIPLVVGVPERHVASWREFTGGLAEEAPLGSPRIQQWLARRGLIKGRDIGGMIEAFPSAA
jgi:hypothetical protein